MYLYVNIVHVFWCSVHVHVLYVCTFYVHSVMYVYSVHVCVRVCTSESPPGTSDSMLLGACLCLDLPSFVFSEVFAKILPQQVCMTFL